MSYKSQINENGALIMITSITEERNRVSQHTTEVDLKECFGERFTALVLRGVVLLKEGVLCKFSL